MKIIRSKGKSIFSLMVNGRWWSGDHGASFNQSVNHPFTRLALRSVLE
ncbi:MAG: hypothetical protein ISR82_06295 [Candidatus Marinimicrobia bacterium]|nr:hypothetical protein [Candidatus Neomarinimicrobiota bacterium]